MCFFFLYSCKHSNRFRWNCFRFRWHFFWRFYLSFKLLLFVDSCQIWSLKWRVIFHDTQLDSWLKNHIESINHKDSSVYVFRKFLFIRCSQSLLFVLLFFMIHPWMIRHSISSLINSSNLGWIIVSAVSWITKSIQLFVIFCRLGYLYSEDLKQFFTSSRPITRWLILQREI